MKQSSRLVLTLLSFLGLIVLARYLTGTPVPSGDKNSWFQAGLLMVVLGSFFIEKHFTKPVDVVVNATAGAITLLSLSDRTKFIYWEYALIGLVSVAVIALLAMTIQTFCTNYRIINFGRLLFRISVFLGSAKRMFSILLFLSLFSYFEFPSHAGLVILIFWGVVVSAEPIGIPRLIESLIDILFKLRKQPIGQVTRVIGGNIFQIQLSSDIHIPKEAMIEITYQSEKFLALPLNAILFRDKKVMNAVSIDSKAAAISDEEGDSEYAVSGLGSAKLLRKDSFSGYSIKPWILENRDKTVGVVDDNSDIKTLRFRMVSSRLLEEGQLVRVYFENEPVIYQIVNAITKSTEREKDEEQFIVVLGQQIGKWNNGKQRFESVGWVANPGSLVFLEESDGPAELDVIREGQHVVGNLPYSSYPIHVRVDDIVTHHTAILGITGSGKTFLAYQLIEKMVSQGIKVFVFDISTDYSTHLAHLNPKVMVSPGEVEPFLESQDLLGIAQFQPTSVSVVKVTADVVERILTWTKQRLGTQQGENLKARVCVVFEEAHSLIPEWNSTSVKGDSDHVNRVSQAILQGRKYGLGALVVTQRTANVTKTILNQCNTIFALQSFDQTGLEFLKNFIGEEYANALSTLLPRQAVLFGKSSSSSRPIIVRLNEHRPGIIVSAREDADTEEVVAEIPIQVDPEQL